MQDKDSATFKCDCGELAHLLELYKFDDGKVSVLLYLDDNTYFWYRLKYAIQCIFRKKSIPASDIILDKTELARFKKFVAKL